MSHGSRDQAIAQSPLWDVASRGATPRVHPEPLRTSLRGRTLESIFSEIDLPNYTLWGCTTPKYKKLDPKYSRSRGQLNGSAFEFVGRGHARLKPEPGSARYSSARGARVLRWPMAQPLITMTIVELIFIPLNLLWSIQYGTKISSQNEL